VLEIVHGGIMIVSRHLVNRSRTYVDKSMKTPL